MSKTGQSRWNGGTKLIGLVAVCITIAFWISGEHKEIRGDTADLQQRLAVVETMVDMLKDVDQNVRKLLLAQSLVPATASPVSDR